MPERSIFDGKVQHTLNAFYLKIAESRFLRFRVNCRGFQFSLVPTLDRPSVPRWEFVPYEYSLPDFEIIGKHICGVELEETKDDVWIYGRKLRTEVKLSMILSDGCAIVFHYEEDLELHIERAKEKHKPL